MSSPLHPGTVLAEDFLMPMRISPSRLARDVGMTHVHVSEIIQGRRSVTADIALRFGRYLGTPAGFWIGLQSRYDLEIAREQFEAEIIESVHPLEAVAGF